MASWRRDGVTVIVSITEDQNHLWVQLHSRLYGITSLDSSATSRVRILSLCEAYYALALDRLLAPPPNVSLTDVWQEFANAYSSFVALYVVYHHFRQLGWLLRSGLNYGAQFVLYRGDAMTFHSEYIVYLHSDTTTTTSVSPSASESSWHTIHALTRVAQDVKKTVVLCEVGFSSLEDEINPTSSITTEDVEVNAHPDMATHATYHIHGKRYALDAVLIRFWDTATVDDDRESFAFTPQPTVLKKKKQTKKNKTNTTTATTTTTTATFLS